MTNTTNDDWQHLVELVSNARVAVLTTTTADGKRISRPMGLQQAEFDGQLWFFAYDGSATATQIKAIPEVNVCFSDTENSAWTSIAGRPQTVHNRTKAEQLYPATLKGWFPEGLETGLTLIKVQADYAEYGEGPAAPSVSSSGPVRAALTEDPDNDPISNDLITKDLITKDLITNDIAQL